MGIGKSLAVVTALAAGAVTYGAVVERRNYTLRRYTVGVLAKGSRPIKVLQLSDLHMAPWQVDKQDWVRELAGLVPDLVVNTGDNLGHRDGIAGIATALEPFSGIPGVFVHGSNDYYGPILKNPAKYLLGPSSKSSDSPRRPDLDTAALEHEFATLGWQDLNNAATELTVKGSTLRFFGLGDPHIQLDRPEKMRDALSEAREQGSADAVEIGVVHAPYQRALNELVDDGAKLIIAGHTHGGQLCIPGVGALVTNCDLPRSKASGLTWWRHGRNQAPLHVSAGLGTSIYAPIRFACKPEATLLTLVPR